MKKNKTSDECQHPASRIFTWFAYDPTTDSNILCAGCCDCGAVLLGGVTSDDLEKINEENKENQRV